MFEKLDRLRADVKRIERINEEKVKLKNAMLRLEKAENEQILEDVSELKLTPEQFNEFLKLASGGILNNHTAIRKVTGADNGSDQDDLSEDEYAEKDEESEETEDEDD